MEPTQITISHTENPPSFIIRDFVDEVLSNKRLIVSLKRLNYSIFAGTIIIPYRKESEIHALQDLCQVLVKFGFSIKLSDELIECQKAYNRENQLFSDFVKRADNIRNNRFVEYPELVNDFVIFKGLIDSVLKRNLYPLQELSAFHLAYSQNACNFSVPGAGKTSIVLAAYSFLKNLPPEDPRHVDKLMVIGPISSFAPWQYEYFNCFGREASIQRLSGDVSISKATKLEHLYSANPSEITLVFHGGVDGLQRDILEFLRVNKTMLVVDEAHRIKNPDGVWGQSITNISKEAVSRVVLTGTPVPNGYEDLYNLFKFLYPFKYKDILQFHYQNLLELSSIDNADDGRILKLKNNISPFFIRIKKTDLNLPPISEQVIPVLMDSIQRDIYDFIELNYIDYFQHDANATVKDILNKSKLIRLRQASTNPNLLLNTLTNSLASDQYGDDYDPNSKYTIDDEGFLSDSSILRKLKAYKTGFTPNKFVAIKELLQKKIDIENNKVIIWTIFIQNAKELQQYLFDCSIQSKLLIGEVPQSEREDIVSRFNNPGDHGFMVVIANPFSVAESISLHQGCHNAIYLERDYNCANYLQSKDRIHRVGLSKDQLTTYYYIVAQDSIDEVIYSCLNEKVKRMESIINDDIPLLRRIDDEDETDIINALLNNYASRTRTI